MPRPSGAPRAHIPRKRFGQHFLVDGAIVDGIVDAIDPRPGQWLVEIGPGTGALTLPLRERVGPMTVIELDRDLVRRWQAEPGLQVVASDVLQVDFSRLGQQPPEGVPGPRMRVVGNLPYNISTPVLFHLLEQVEVIIDQHFMLQKEVVDRMVASPSTEAYGRLSVMLQWRYAMQNFLFVPPESFDPPPRVDSAVVRMLPREAPVPVDRKLLEDLVRVAFSQRRKLLRHSLGPWLEARAYAGSFDLRRRAEEVPVDAYLALAQELG